VGGSASAREHERDDASEPASKPDTDHDPQPEPQQEREFRSRTEPEPQPEREPAPEVREPEFKAANLEAEAEPTPERREPESEAAADPETEAEPQPRLRRPVRWGDRVKPTDVLVHPRQSRAAEKDVDTQPVAVIADTPSARGGSAASQEGRDTVPDPHHGAEAADEHERRDAGAPGTGGAAELRDESMEDTAPHPVLPDSSHAQDAPSGRLRSTPLPPED
jgi:hypothetical protein